MFQVSSPRLLKWNVELGRWNLIGQLLSAKADSLQLDVKPVTIGWLTAALADCAKRMALPQECELSFDSTLRVLRW